jgi:uncharacterized protein (TIGR03083 family)
MTGTEIPKDRTINALASVWSSIRDLLETLTDDEWALPSPLPGWDVQANVAHIIGTEAMLLGEPSPEENIDRDAATHVRNDIGAFNEVWVQALAAREPAEVLAIWDDFMARRLTDLREMPLEEWNAETMTPVGRESYGRFMQIRVFDCWFHEQDIRAAIGRPGHLAGQAVVVTLDEMVGAMGFVVGKRAGAPEGSRVRFELTGSSGRVIDVEVGDRAVVVEQLSADPTVVISMDAVAFTRLCGGRLTLADLRSEITITGDTALGETILANANYTI